MFNRSFQSVGPRHYSIDLKEAANGNHFLVLTEEKRDPKTGDMKRNSIYIFSEDFDSFWNLLRDAAGFVKRNPLPPEFQLKRSTFWKNQKENKTPGTTANPPALRQGSLQVRRQSHSGNGNTAKTRSRS